MIPRTSTAARAGRARRRKGRVAWLFLAPFLVAFSASIVGPLVYAGYLSAYKKQLVGGTSFAGAENYLRAFSDPLFIEGVGRVLGFLAVQVPIMLGISLLAALAIDSGRLGATKGARILLFLPYAIPAVVATLMWGYIFGGQFGLVGQVARAAGLPTPDLLGSGLMMFSIGNIVTWSFMGYNMLIFYAALRSVPAEVYEAAEIDGAGEFRKAWAIKMPAIRPSLAVAVIFSVIGSIQLFNEPSVLQALSPAVITTNYTPNLYTYNLAFSGSQANYSAALAILLGGMTVVIAYVAQWFVARRDRIL